MTAVGLVGAALAAEEAAEPLRLVATVNGQEFDRFFVKDRALMTGEGATAKPLTGRLSWRVDGDLSARTGDILFSPIYSIKPAPHYGTARVDARRFEAQVTVSRDDLLPYWDKNDLEGGIAVALWVQDGRLIHVCVTPLPDDENFWGTWLGEIRMPLSAEERSGAPPLLLWSDGRFVRPRPIFNDRPTEDLVAKMFLGTTAEFDAHLAAMPMVDSRGHQRVTLLHLAAEGGLRHATAALLARGAQPDAATSRFNTPLLWAAGNGRTDSRDLLLAARPIKDYSNDDAEYIAWGSSGAGDLDFTLQLLDARNGWRDWKRVIVRTARQAAQEGRIDVLETIYARGQKRAIIELPPELLAELLRRRELATVRWLLAHGTEPREKARRTSPLHVAAAYGDTDIVEALLKANAGQDALDQSDRTPLLLAARNGHTDAVRLLLASGASPARRDVNGMLALHLAVLSGSTDVVSALLPGSPLETRDTAGRTALELACIARTTGAIDALRSAGARLDVASKQIDAVVEGIIAMDRADLLSEIVTAGWSLGTVLHGSWPLDSAARILGAESVSTWLHERLPAAAHPPLYTGRDFDTAPRPLVLYIDEETYGGVSTRAETANVGVIGVINEAGRFVFARPLDSGDDTLNAALVTSTDSWRFRPATKAGAPINLFARFTPAVLPVNDRVYEWDEVDVPARYVSGTALPPQEITRTVVVESLDYTFARGIIGPTVNREFVTEHVGTRPEEVVFSLVVERDGIPSCVEILWGYAFARATLNPKELVESWRFTPAVRDGRAVRMHLTFRLGTGT